MTVGLIFFFNDKEVTWNDLDEQIYTDEIFDMIFVFIYILTANWTTGLNNSFWRN